jgi:hypothetical protein
MDKETKILVDKQVYTSLVESYKTTSSKVKVIKQALTAMIGKQENTKQILLASQPEGNADALLRSAQITFIDRVIGDISQLLGTI